MCLDLSVADLNRRQAIGPPADPRPLRADGRAGRPSRVPSLFAGAGFVVGVSAAKPATAYDRCLTEAGSTLAAVQLRDRRPTQPSVSSRAVSAPSSIKAAFGWPSTWCSS